MIPIFQGKVEQEQHDIGLMYVKYDSEIALYRYLKPLLDQRVEVIIRKPKTKRSDNQSRYYWGVVIEMISTELGYDQDEMHEILKYKFLQSHETGMSFVRSTTKLSTREFEEYLDKIKRWAAEFLHINVPNPNEAEAA